METSNSTGHVNADINLETATNDQPILNQGFVVRKGSITPQGKQQRDDAIAQLREVYPISVPE